MKWHVVIQHVLDLLHADVVLQSLMGDTFRVRHASEWEAERLPETGISWAGPVSDVEEEVLNPIEFQLTIRTRDDLEPAIVTNARIQTRIRGLLHRETFHADFGEYMSTRYLGTESIDDGQYGHTMFGLFFRLIPLRSKYPLEASTS